MLFEFGLLFFLLYLIVGFAVALILSIVFENVENEFGEVTFKEFLVMWAFWLPLGLLMMVKIWELGKKSGA